MTVGDHFDRVAAVYESLRTTDEAPVRWIGQLLPDRPVTGLDIGCGTGRYSRLLRGLLPDGSLLVGSDVSAAMLAQLKAGNHGPRGRGAAGIRRRRAAIADRQPRPGHGVQLRSPLRPRSVPDRRRPGAAARRPAVHLHPHPAAERVGRSGAAISRVSPSTSSACTARPHSGTPSRVPTGSRWSQRGPSGTRARARPGGSGPRPRATTTRRSRSTPRMNCARPSRRSWPVCPAPRSPGLTSTSWSSSAGAAATRRSLTVRAARRASSACLALTACRRRRPG